MAEAGNSLAYAAGRGAWRAAIDGMAFVLRTGGVTTELLSIWPFQQKELHADVAVAGLSLTGSTYDAAQTNYLVTAQRRAGST